MVGGSSPSGGTANVAVEWLPFTLTCFYFEVLLERLIKTRNFVSSAIDSNFVAI